MSIALDQSALEKVLRWLARREHSVKQLKDKLAQRQVDAETAQSVIAHCTAQGWQSDARYAESYIRHRVSAGWGALSIGHQLRQHGVSESLVAEKIAAAEVDWWALAVQVYHKKFPTDFLAVEGEQYYLRLAKVQRFLQQRGFDAEQIKCAVRSTQIPI